MSDLAILTKKKKVIFQNEEGQNKSVVNLYPFAFKHFNDAISIINKYFDCYQKVRDEYNSEVQFILGHDGYDKDTKEKKLKFFADSFDEIGAIVRNVLASKDGSLAEDISSIVGFCCRSPISLEDFHWGEVGALLASAIEVNMDFFTQNKDKITLLKATPENQLPKTGD